MKIIISTVIFFLGLILTGFAGILYANEYQAMSGFVANDCDGLIRIFIFLIPGTLLLGAGTLLLWKHSPMFRRLRWISVGLTFFFWASIVALKARDISLHYSCE